MAVADDWKAEVTGDRTVTVTHPGGHEFVMRFNSERLNEYFILREHYGSGELGPLRQAASAAARVLGKARGWTY